MEGGREGEKCLVHVYAGACAHRHLTSGFKGDG